MTPDLICGVDPGINGGIALLTGEGEIVGCYPMPETQQEILDVLAEFAPRIIAVALELVGAMPKQGIASTALFMRNYGFLQGIITALQIRREEIRPQVWQKGLGIVPRGEKSKTEHKAALRQKAQQLWPKQKITNKTADALLIAEYLRRTLK